MWILKEHFQNDNITSVDVELENNETEEWVTDYLRKHYYPKAVFNFTKQPNTNGYVYHKVEDIHPHVNVIEVNKVKRF